MIALPFVAIILAIVWFRRGHSLLEAAVSAFVMFGVAVSLLTELQSATHTLTHAGSTIGWGVFVLALLVVLRARRGPAAPPGEQGPFPILAFTVIAAFLAITLVTALVSAPNSYDAMTYHLARVERWIQQGSLAPFATFDTRQLFMPSWAEYALLQFQLLSGGDHFANLVQWLCYAGSCAGAAMLALSLGGSRTARNVAAVLVATLPMAIAQASGTQTDVAAACWAVIACAWGYAMLRSEAPRRDMLFCALSLGLAAATKQTGLLFAAFGLVPAVAALFLGRRSGRAATLVLASGVAVALLAGPQLIRNREVFGAMQGDSVWVSDAAMGTHAPGAVTCNVLRNLSLHFGTPSGGVNEAVAGAAAAGCRAVGANPDDPRTTWNPRFIAAPWTTHEESAPNPLQLVLIFVAFLLTWWVTRSGAVRWFPVAMISAIVAFSVALKWQSYNSRLETPFFALALAWGALAVERLRPRWRQALVSGLAITALPAAVCNYTRPLAAIRAIAPRPSIFQLPRELTYFMYDPALARPYLDVAHRIAATDCRDVGMHTWPDAWEYAVMAVVHADRPEVGFRPIGVTNASARFSGPDRPPCLLLQIWPGAETPPSWASGWASVVAWKGPPDKPGVALFRPE